MLSVKQMLSDLILSGKSQSALARELGTSQSTIHRIVEKNQGVGYELGKKIEHLYLMNCQKKAA